MLNKDVIQKFKIYIDNEAYWRLTDLEQELAITSSCIGRYPLNLTMRLDQGHYTHFDEVGLPIRFTKDRTPYHNFTTVCSYALANWERYLVSGRIENAHILKKSADFILANSVQIDGSILVCDDRNNYPQPSAMNQGEAISVLCRAWEFTGEDKYLKAAEGCLLPFTRDIDVGGVSSSFSWEGTIKWYEEYTKKPVRHVLNGFIYALWGIHDLVAAADNECARHLFDQGISSLEKALPYFNMGFWSSYAISEPNQKRTIASMMYHNLHTVQLQSLYQITQHKIFQEMAKMFEIYSRRLSNRLRAGVLLLLRKAKIQ